MSTIEFRTGDCLDVFGAEPDASFDAFVCDPPSGTAFMGRQWDRPDALAAAHIDDAFAAYLRTLDRETRAEEMWVHAWRERFAVMLRKMKPGAYALVWALPRTADWTTRALRRAGFRIQDVIVHVFGQGWNKVGDIAKQAEKQGVDGVEAGQAGALKPASEHWIVAQRPIEKRLTIAGNVAKWGTGALQIDASRVARGGEDIGRDTGTNQFWRGKERVVTESNPAGSWPANFVLSHCPECEERGTRRVRAAVNNGSLSGKTSGAYGERSGAVAFDYAGADGTETVPAFDCLAACDCGAFVLAPAGGAAPRCACGRAMWWACPVAQLDADSSAKGMHSAGGKSEGIDRGPRDRMTYNGGAVGTSFRHGDTENGSAASRFFHRFTYQAKAAGGERHAGCEALYWRRNPRNPFGFDLITRAEWEALPDDERAQGNVHPTVKSIALMEHLVGLVTPPGGRVGDITAGSGGTGIAAHRRNITRGLGVSFLGADICPEAVAIAEARLAWWRAVRHDVKPMKPSGEAEADPRQVTIFDFLGASNG